MLFILSYILIVLFFCGSSIKGMAANNWLAQADYVMTSHADEKEKASVMERISQLVDLFYKAVDADKSGEKVCLVLLVDIL
jgi:hypothetical protein